MAIKKAYFLSGLAALVTLFLAQCDFSPRRWVEARLVVLPAKDPVARASSRLGPATLAALNCFAINIKGTQQPTTVSGYAGFTSGCLGLEHVIGTFSLKQLLDGVKVRLPSGRGLKLEIVGIYQGGGSCAGQSLSTLFAKGIQGLVDVGKADADLVVGSTVTVSNGFIPNAPTREDICRQNGGGGTSSGGSGGVGTGGGGGFGAVRLVVWTGQKLRTLRVVGDTVEAPSAPESQALDVPLGNLVQYVLSPTRESLYLVGVDVMTKGHLLAFSIAPDAKVTLADDKPSGPGQPFRGALLDTKRNFVYVSEKSALLG